MKGGIGGAAITLPNGLVVAAIVAVNARGDVVDPRQAGRRRMRTEDGKGLADVRRRLKSGELELPLPEALQHTTIGIVATNATLTKTQATRIAQMAHDGLARAIVPAHTSADGDAIFALATGTRQEPADLDTIGALAADAMAEAILRAVRAATGIPGYPAAAISVSLTLVLLVVYSLLMAGVGLWVGRRVRATGDFFVAGRSLGPTLIFATFLAGNIGAGSTVGAAGLAIATASAPYGGTCRPASVASCSPFRSARGCGGSRSRYGDLTVGDFLERHYGRDLRLAVAILIWIGTLSILAAQLLGMSTVFQVVAGASPFTGCLLGAVLVSVYFVAGGLLSSAYVNLVQLAVKLAGFALVTPMALALAGGWDAVAADRRGSICLPAARRNRVGGCSSFWPGVCRPSPGLIQKAYGARRARGDHRHCPERRRADGLRRAPNAHRHVGALHPDIDKDLAFATMASRLTPAFGALALAAVFSAEASAADAVLFMLATSGSRDLYRRLKPAATDATCFTRRAGRPLPARSSVWGWR